MEQSLSCNVGKQKVSGMSWYLRVLRSAILRSKLRRSRMKTNRPAFLIMTGILLTFAIARPARLSAASAAQWTLQVSKVDSGAVGLTPSFRVAIYENLLQELSKTKRFKEVLRDGDQKAMNATNLLLLRTTVKKYTEGSETRRAVTTITGATKLTVQTQLFTPGGKNILDRTVNGNVRFMGSNLRATHNLARNIAKTVKKSSLPEPQASAVSKAMTSASSNEAVFVELP